MIGSINELGSQEAVLFGRAVCGAFKCYADLVTQSNSRLIECWESTVTGKDSTSLLSGGQGTVVIRYHGGILWLVVNMAGYLVENLSTCLDTPVALMSTSLTSSTHTLHIHIPNTSTIA